MPTLANQATSSYQEEAFAVWENFIAGKPLGDHSIPPYIVNGWKLSRKAGIDPYTGNTPPVLTPKELDKLLSKNRLLLRAAEPMLDMLAVSIRDTGYIATFAAPSGHLLEVVGDENLMEQARAQYNIPGADRSIKAVGASALTLAIIEKKPVMVQGVEHYNKLWHDWRCAAAPIFDSDNNPIASLTISSHISLRDPHVLTLAKSCATGISIRMREIVLLENEQRLNAMLESVHNALPELVLAVDHEGAITHANNSAISYLGLSPNSINRNLKEFVGTPDYARVQRLLKDGESAMLEVEILSHQGPQNHVCRFSPISVKGFGSRGMTISISKQRELLALTKHVSWPLKKSPFDEIFFFERIRYEHRQAGRISGDFVAFI